MGATFLWCLYPSGILTSTRTHPMLLTPHTACYPYPSIPTGLTQTEFGLCQVRLGGGGEVSQLKVLIHKKLFSFSNNE